MMSVLQQFEKLCEIEDYLMELDNQTPDSLSIQKNIVDLKCNLLEQIEAYEKEVTEFKAKHLHTWGLIGEQLHQSLLEFQSQIKLRRAGC